MTRLFTFAILLALIASCGNQVKQADATCDTGEATVAELLADAFPFVDQAVTVQGTVVHVCRHGGQRLFMVGPDSEDRFRCTTGEDIAEFEVALEGSLIEVTGIVKELIIDETYLAEWETEVTGGTDEHARGEGHEGGVGHGEHAEGDEQSPAEGEDAAMQNEAALKQIQALRDQIAASGKDHLSDYWIETISFKVLEEAEAVEEVEEVAEKESHE